MVGAWGQLALHPLVHQRRSPSFEGLPLSLWPTVSALIDMIRIGHSSAPLVDCLRIHLRRTEAAHRCNLRHTARVRILSASRTRWRSRIQPHITALSHDQFWLNNDNLAHALFEASTSLPGPGLAAAEREVGFAKLNQVLPVIEVRAICPPICWPAALTDLVAWIGWLEPSPGWDSRLSPVP
jgi:hypothetical protein